VISAGLKVWKMTTIEVCPVCQEKTNPEAFPICSRCGVLLVDPEDLDLSPEADLTVIFKRARLTYLQ
jgi:hypothetical protein